MNALIVKVFHAWCKKHLRAGTEPTIRHAFKFLLDLPHREGERFHTDHWTTICSALRDAGIIGVAEEHITPRWLTDDLIEGAQIVSGKAQTNLILLASIQ